MDNALTLTRADNATAAAGTDRSRSVFERPLIYAPLIPEFVLRASNTFIATDARFGAAARLLSALWREEQKIPIGAVIAGTRGDTRRIKLGSRISGPAARVGANFMTNDVTALAKAELLFREPGSVWNEERLWTNLLSSQCLTINLWAPLAFDLDLATAVWSKLLPGFVQTVTRIRFEHSPGRFQETYFGDGTAFDVLVDIVTPDGEPGFVAVEIKYVEEMLAPPARHRDRYDETTRECGLFIDPEDTILTRAGFEQLRREHVMAQLMVDNGLASRGKFITIVPRLNRRAVASNALYAAELHDATGDQPHDDGRERVGFQAFTLETVVRAIADHGAAEYASALWGRYCDFHRVVRHVMESLVATPSGSAFDAGKSHSPRATAAKAPVAPKKRSNPSSAATAS
ncbi:PGN_0703 family putative restriction endonuclease [Mesorhizobium sp. 128a]